MGQNSVSTILGLAVVAWLSWPPGPALAASLSIDQPSEGAAVVTGRAAAGSGPITIYDTSFDVPTPIGQGNYMDAAGNFAVSVSPLLAGGNTIVAKDAAGNQSTPTTVIEFDNAPRY